MALSIAREVVCKLNASILLPIWRAQLGCKLTSVSPTPPSQYCLSGQRERNKPEGENAKEQQMFDYTVKRLEKMLQKSRQ